MKKTLSITAFIIAGSACAMADIASLSKWGGGYASDLNTSTHEYSSNVSFVDRNFNGTHFRKIGEGWGVENYNSKTSIDLSKDARYEINFEFSSSGGGTSTGNQPLGNFYLGGNSSVSLIFGNYYMNQSQDVGAARIYSTYGNAAGGSLESTGRLNSTYILNDSWSNGLAGWNYQPPSHNKTAYAGGKISDGWHSYCLVIESYSDSTPDVFSFYYYLGGTKMSVEGELARDLGVGSNINFSDIGFFLHDAGGAVDPSVAQVYSYTRTPIPEPSAFGLLAGLGALCLVGARRRRR